MDEREHESDWDSSEAHRSQNIGRAQYGEHQEHGENDLCEKARAQRKPARRMSAIAIRSQAGGACVVTTRQAFGNRENDRRRDDCADNLRNDVSNGVAAADFAR